MKINRVIVFASGCSAIGGLIGQFPGATIGLIIGILLGVFLKE